MLRPELQPPTSAERPRLRALVGAAYERLDAGEAAVDVAADFQRESGRPMSPDELDAWYGSEDPGQVAAALLAPPAHVLRRLQLTREELVEVARRLMPTSADYDEANERWWTALFDANVPHPDGSALIYHPPDRRSRRRESWNPTPEEVVDLALAYEPIRL